MSSTFIKLLCILAVIGLEALTVCSEPLLETRQIEIPNYPNAYNPSIVPYKGGYLLSFRYQTRFPRTMQGPRMDVSMIGVVKLSEDFVLDEESVQLLHLRSYSKEFSLTAEDGRLFMIGDRLFLFFNDLFEGSEVGECAMYMAELEEERGGDFVVKGSPKPLLYEHATRKEKNWSPFVKNGKCYCIYSDQPERIILQVDVETGLCREAGKEEYRPNWTFGQIRGGTPALDIGGEMLAFFHSSFYSNRKAVYVMGAYLFDQEFPFRIRAMSRLPLAEAKDYEKMGQVKLVEFPGGLIVEDEFVHVAWGKDDRKLFLTTFDKKKLIESMKPL
jgi:predicted GH43/DUF377 family glycosyl hydrolase